MATLVARDLETDLAIIKIDLPSKLPVIPIGTSSDLMPGESVIAVGNAYGYEHTVTRGIISALHRAVQVSDAQFYDDLIQTDASINPGNSGGPLLNIDGEMIGINVAVRAGAQGIGFAIPVDKAMTVAATLLGSAAASKAWHGRGAGPGRPRIALGHEGGRGREEEPGRRGRPAGRRRGHRRRRRGGPAGPGLPAGDAGPQGRATRSALTVRRDGKPLTLSLELAELPESLQPAAGPAWELLGLELRPIPADRVPAEVSDPLPRRADGGRRAAQQPGRRAGHPPRRRAGGHAHLGNGLAGQRGLHPQAARLRHASTR